VGIHVTNLELVDGRLSWYIKNLDTSQSHLLQRLFMSPRTAKHMTWHQSHHAVDGVMVHPSDGEA